MLVRLENWKPNWSSKKLCWIKCTKKCKNHNRSHRPTEQRHRPMWIKIKKNSSGHSRDLSQPWNERYLPSLDSPVFEEFLFIDRSSKRRVVYNRRGCRHSWNNLARPRLVHPYRNQVFRANRSSITIISFFFSLALAPTHPQEVILIVNKRDDTPKTQQTPASLEESSKASATSVSPRAVRQRERSGVETDDDDLLAQMEKLLDGQTPGVGEDELLKEKIIEARLIAQRKAHSTSWFLWTGEKEKLLSFLLLVKAIYTSFMTEKENLAKLEQQMNEKSIDFSNTTPIMTSTPDGEPVSNQTVDILQELLNTIKQNNQLEVLISLKFSPWIARCSFSPRRKSKRSNETSKMKTNESRICALSSVSAGYPAKFIFTTRRPPLPQLLRTTQHWFKWRSCNLVVRMAVDQ